MMSLLNNHTRILRLALAVLFVSCIMPAMAQRKVSPVNNAATATQPINEFEGDTARINARMRASMTHYRDDKGNLVYVDTVTGKEWIDSAAMIRKIPMIYPLLQSASVSVDLWNPLMRIFGQHYGIIDFAANVNLHNRYLPTFETGIGQAHYKPADMNYTYNSPMSVYFRAGLDYNFLYNSTPAYQLTAGVRYGFSAFRYSLDDVTIESSYWDETSHPHIPSQGGNAGWVEVTLGLKVQLGGPISAGWTFRYHSILHQNNPTYGRPWYIPGYGARGSAFNGSVYITYTFDFPKKDKADAVAADSAEIR